MGINNLNSFITEYGLRKPYQLSNTYVVIDGFNLCYGLYEDFIKTNPNDFLFGGNYTEYRILFENFFENLIKCNIKPIIVFDGESNPNLIDSRIVRFKQKIEISKQFSDCPPILPLCSVRSGVNPRLLKKLLKSVAQTMKVHCFTTDLDADLEMAKLAIHLDCPVISNDTDFFVMNIKRGVISSDSLKWQNIRFNQSKQYIECEVYKVDDLLEFKFYERITDHFRVQQIKLKAEMLPIFGSLLGNDGIDGQLFDDLFNKIVEQTNQWSLITDSLSHSQLFKHKRWRRMDQLLCWLTFGSNNIFEVISKIESHINRNPKALQQFRDSLKSYDTNGKSDLKELLDNKLMTNGDAIPIDTTINEDRLSKSNRINSVMASRNETKVCYKRPLIEDFNLESTFESSIRLKRFHLGLCRTDRNEQTPVLFFMRKGQSFEQMLIYPENYIDISVIGMPIIYKVLPILPEIKNLSDIERKKILFDILKFEEQWITDLEDYFISIAIEREDIQFWKYFLIVIIYWKSNSKMDESIKFQYIQAFVQKLIYFRHNSLIRNDFKGMTSIAFCSGQRFKPFAIHYYNEFQSLYSSIDKLVSLLGDPITASKLHHYFNGYLLYNLFNDIINKPFNVMPFKEDRLNTIYKVIINCILNTYKH